MKKAAMVVGALAVTLAVTTASSATVRRVITGADIKSGSITSREIKNGSLAAVDLNAAAIASLHGATGATGTAGLQGPAGAKGDTGPQGAKGATGSNGATGANGADGASGLKGDKGDPGLAGPQGPAGGPGPAGANGAAGANGEAGANGAAGANGVTGAIGPQGPAGADGTAGAKGDTGDAGGVGPQGPAGANGLSKMYATELTGGTMHVAGTDPTVLTLGIPGDASYLLMAKLNFVSNEGGALASCSLTSGDGANDQFVVRLGNGFETSNSLLLPHTYGSGAQTAALTCEATEGTGFDVTAARLVAVQSQSLSVLP